MNGGALAFIGDAVYELWIREYLIKSGNTVLEKLNAEKVKFVSQTAQLEAVNKLLPFFTEKMQELLSRVGVPFDEENTLSEQLLQIPEKFVITEKGEPLYMRINVK